MSTQVEERKANTAVTSDTFADVMTGYTQVSALVDAIVRSDDPSADIDKAHNVIAALRSLQVNGKGFTPPADKGFGSENAAGIASALLGERVSAAKIRATVRKGYRS